MRRAPAARAVTLLRHLAAGSAPRPGAHGAATRPGALLVPLSLWSCQRLGPLALCLYCTTRIQGVKGFVWYILQMAEEQKRRGRPFTTGTTKKRDVRVGDVWDEAAALARARGETMRQVLERALKNYVHRYHVPRTAEGDQAASPPDSAP